jgi:hypothetical protein
VKGTAGDPVFVASPAPTDADIQHLVERTAQRLVRLLQRRGLLDDHQSDPLADPAGGQRTSPLCYAARGFSLHAATRVPAHDRTRLEQLCRYVLRPPLAAARLRWLDPDTLSLALKTPWADGTTHLRLSPHELLEKLAALVPRRGNT